MKLTKGQVFTPAKVKLTPREKELISYIKEDHFIQGKELACKMNIALGTVKYFIGNINKKLKVKSRRDLVNYIQEKLGQE